MTSNAGSRELSNASIGFCGGRCVRARARRRQKAAQQRSKQAIEKVFSPEFRNRLDAIVSFDPLTPAVMETIVEKFILQLEAQLAERRHRDHARARRARSGSRRRATTRSTARGRWRA